MTFSLSILVVVLAYTWALEPTVPRAAAPVPVVLVLALAAWRALRTREWGLRRAALVPAFAWAAVVTAAGAAVIYLAGERRGVFSPRSLFVLIPWAIGQQFALQIVFLREAQQTTSKRAGIVLAAALFAALHLPNPFLTCATFVAALAWCWIYDRYPNLMPLALSHALLTLVVLYALDDAITGRLRVGAAYLDLR